MSHTHHHEVGEKTFGYLLISFIINMLLSIAEIIGGIISGSIALIGDALHNTSDALSILVAVVAFKIGRRRANERYTYGFKRAEVIGGFVNLILLLISGIYLAVEGIMRLITPHQVDGIIIILISVLALLIDTATACLSHHGSSHNTNLRMVFVHNLADALGSLGVIVSGVCAVYGNIYRVDGIIALLIAAYMIYQSIISFPKIVDILMNAAPSGLSLDSIRADLAAVKGVKDVHHLHVWSVSENIISTDCHLVADTTEPLAEAIRILSEKYGIEHCNIQIEQTEGICHDCEL